MFVLAVICFIIATILICYSIAVLKNPKKDLEKLKLANPTNKRINEMTEKKLVINTILTLICGIMFVVFCGMCMYYAVTNDYTNKARTNNSTVNGISEKQMNDLGYVKENGKWNYEGGDAGQNDGVAGD